ncbi:twin-arginine translocation pathway signal [Moniliophthora roreri]|nr:twin-arginine translocation pathway signal [Moniliophthora roreri]
MLNQSRIMVSRSPDTKIGEDQQVVAPQTDDTVSAVLKIDMSISDLLKYLVTSGLGYIPEVGGILSSIVGTLWPDTPEESEWSKVRQEVEALIDQKIDDAAYNLIAAKLPGLGDSSKLYLKIASGHGSGDAIRTQWVATNTVYTAAASEFMNSKYEWTLGPLFAIFSVLHTTLLRDAVLHGQEWGWSPDDYKVYVQFTKDTLNKYLTYYDKVLKNRYDALAKNQPPLGQHKTEVYNYWQPYNQQLVVAFDDYHVLVRYLDPLKHPNPTPPSDLPFQDAYSPAYGTADDWDATANSWAGWATTPWSKPLKGIREIYIELFDYGPRVLQVRHDAGTGPMMWGDASNRSDEYGIIAEPQKGVEIQHVKFLASPSDYTYNVKGATIRAGSIPLALTLLMYDDSERWLWDNSMPYKLSELSPRTQQLEVEGGGNRELGTLPVYGVSGLESWVEQQPQTAEQPYLLSTKIIPEIMTSPSPAARQ